MFSYVLVFPFADIGPSDGDIIVNMSERPVHLLDLKNSRYTGMLPACDSRLMPYVFKEEQSYFDRNQMENVKTENLFLRFPPRAAETCKLQAVTMVVVEHEVYELLQRQDNKDQYPWWHKAVESSMSFGVNQETKAVVINMHYVLVQ